jgi:hypothetical protein
MSLKEQSLHFCVKRENLPKNQANIRFSDSRVYRGMLTISFKVELDPLPSARHLIIEGLGKRR